MAPGPKSKKEANANALAAFHHVVAKGQIERVKDFVVVRTPTFSLRALASAAPPQSPETPGSPYACTCRVPGRPGPATC